MIQNEHELNEALFKVLKLNPNALLSGSYGLALQGYELNREIGDLDFEIPYKEKPRFDKELVYVQNCNEEYKEATHEIDQIAYKNIKINFFQAKKEKDEIKAWDWGDVWIDEDRKKGVKCVDYQEILRKKLEIAMNPESDRKSYEKHSKDLIEILQKNIK